MSAITGLASAKAGSRQGPVMARRDAYLAHVPLGACRTRAAYLAPALDAHALVARPSSTRLLVDSVDPSDFRVAQKRDPEHVVTGL